MLNQVCTQLDFANNIRFFDIYCVAIMTPHTKGTQPKLKLFKAFVFDIKFMMPVLEIRKCIQDNRLSGNGASLRLVKESVKLVC